MYCPKCGTSSPGDQNFCKSCGLNLAKVTRALETEFDTDELEPTAEDASRRALRRAFHILPWGLLFLFTGVIIVIFGDEIAHVPVVSSVGMIILLLGVIGCSVPFLSPDIIAPAKSRKRSRAKSLRAAEQAALPAEPFSIDVPSVTEVTTRKLADRERSTR